MKLSIIIPFYNSERDIDRCLSSILAQEIGFTYEIILVDDGSADNTLQLLEEYEKKDPLHIRVFTKENSGAAGARNLGLSEAGGEFVAFVDADDYLVDKNYFDFMVRMACEKNLDIIRCGVIEKYNDREVLLSHEELSVSGEIGGSILKISGYPHSGIYRRRVWERVMFPEGYWFEDMILRFSVYRLARGCEYTGEVRYCYNLANAESMSNTAGKNIRSVEHCFLAENMIILNDQLGLPRDAVFYRLMLCEFSRIMSVRLKGMDTEIQRAAFSVGCEVLNRLWPDEYSITLSKREKKLWAMFSKSSFLMWRLTRYL